jgi:hypothetical protein
MLPKHINKTTSFVICGAVLRFPRDKDGKHTTAWLVTSNDLERCGSPHTMSSLTVNLEFEK